MRKLHHELVWHRLQAAAIRFVTFGLSRDARGPAPLVISDGPGGLGGREAGRAAGAFEPPWFSVPSPRRLHLRGCIFHVNSGPR